MSMIVRAFPVKSSVKDVEAFAAALGSERKAEATAFYRKYGVSHETWHVQETPSGPWVIAVTVVDDPVVSAPQLAVSETAFDAWFKQQVMRITGVDQAEKPLGPPTSQVFVWSDERRPNASLLGD